MANPVLLILAAGLGSRYGTLKQLEQIGPNGETIMDYAIKDASIANFDKVVFVIRREMEDDFKSIILPKYVDKMKVNYVFQELDTLPDSFLPNRNRTKPYGTAHAILSAKNVITDPFVVINADDYYGKNAYSTIFKFLAETTQTLKPLFAMVGYKLNKTLSENGTVSRGICNADSNGLLTEIRENTHIKRLSNGIKNCPPDAEMSELSENLIVSMNFWGFTPLIFKYLDDLFIEFLKNNYNNITAEFTIPFVINYLISNNIIDVKILQSDAEWFGVTYKEDRNFVIEKLKNI